MSEMLKGMVTEQELLKLMNLKPSELTSLRLEKGLPFVKLSLRIRVYLEDDLMEWFKGRRIVLNRDMKPSVTPIKASDNGLKASETRGFKKVRGIV